MARQRSSQGAAGDIIQRANIGLVEHYDTDEIAMVVCAPQSLMQCLLILVHLTTADRRPFCLALLFGQTRVRWTVRGALDGDDRISVMTRQYRKQLGDQEAVAELQEDAKEARKGAAGAGQATAADEERVEVEGADNVDEDAQDEAEAKAEGVRRRGPAGRGVKCTAGDAVPQQRGDVQRVARPHLLLPRGGHDVRKVLLADRRVPAALLEIEVL